MYLYPMRACFDDGYERCAYDDAKLESPFLGPRVLGDRYLLEQRLAQGAMGLVFRATHLQIGSTVAVKIGVQPQKKRCEWLSRVFTEKRKLQTNQTPQCNFSDGFRRR